MSDRPPAPPRDPKADRLAERVAALFGVAVPEGVDPVQFAATVLDRAEADRRLPAYAAPTIDQATDALFSVSAHEFDVRVPSEGSGGRLDGLAVAVNVLAGELARTAVSTAQLASLLESLPNPVLVVDLDRRVRDANPAARAMLGTELEGRFVHEVLEAEESIWPRAATPVRLTALLDEAHLLFSVAPMVSHYDDVQGFVAVGTNITEQVHTQQALTEARDLAEANARARSQFLANMSHEIRTPLNGVLGMAQLLLNEGLDKRHAHLVGNIRASGEHLLALINDVLDFSKIDAGHVELEIRRFDPAALVERSVEILAPQQTDKVKLVVEVAEDVPGEVLGDALRVRQILLNLVSNALKFTDDGRITVRLAVQRTERFKVFLRFEVEDSGVGIASEHLSALFDPFTQADSSTTREFGGTGLGLAIVQRMVGLLGGEVGVESRVGVGSKFWFVVPFERRSGQRVPTFDPTTSTDALPVVRIPSTGPLPAMRPSTTPDAPDLTGRQVLLVEDNPINQKVAIHMVRRMGAEVVVAGNGAEALDRVREARFDLILMDCQMPVMDGLEATRRLRRIPNGYTVPVVALTADAVAGQRERCIEAGMNEYLSKPLRIADLERTLSQLLTSSTGADD